MEHEMQEQLFVNRYQPTEQLFAEHKNKWQLKDEYNRWNGHSSPFSGMWTSTFMGAKRGSAWVQFCLRGGGVGAWNHHVKRWQSWKLIVDESARVYHLDSAKALNKLLKQYPDYGPSDQRSPALLGQPGPYPDWGKVTQDYDAVHMTESGLAALGKRLRDWDCESTVWFEWKFRDVRNLGMLPFVL
jgi:hypothetical protein